MTFPPVPEAGPEPAAGWQRVSQRELSLMAGRSDGLVGHLEGGRTKDSTVETTTRLCAILGITTDWLATGKQPAHPGGGELNAEIVNHAVRATRTTEAA